MVGVCMFCMHTCWHASTASGIFFHFGMRHRLAHQLQHLVRWLSFVQSIAAILLQAQAIQGSRWRCGEAAWAAKVTASHRHAAAGCVPGVATAAASISSRPAGSEHLWLHMRLVWQRGGEHDFTYLRKQASAEPNKRRSCYVNIVIFCLMSRQQAQVACQRGGRRSLTWVCRRLTW